MLFRQWEASDAAQAGMDRGLCALQFDNIVDAANKVEAVWLGQHAEYVKQTLQARYHPETFVELKVNHGIQTWNNVLRDLVQRLAVGWTEGAQYTLTADDGSEYDGPGFAEFLRLAGLDNLMKRVDTLTELHSRVAVGPAVVESPRIGKRRFAWSVLRPGEFFPIASAVDPTDYVALDVYGGEVDAHGVRRPTKRRWMAESVTTFANRSGQWVLLSQEENPYRLIPFVLFGRDRPVTSLWCEVPGPELADVTIEIGAWETFLGVLGSGQVRVLAGEFGKFPAGQVLRNAGVIDVGNAQNVNMLDFQTDVDRFVKVYVQRLRDAAALSVGLEPEGATGADQPSGTSLALRYWNRDRRAVSKRSFLVSSLTELFWMAQHVLSYQARVQGAAPIAGLTELIPYNADTLDTGGRRFSVDVNEIAYPETAAERMAAEDRELAMGFTNRAELYLKRNPDATQEEAVKAVLTNLQLEARMKQLETRPTSFADKRIAGLLGVSGA